MPPARPLDTESETGLQGLAREQASLRRVATLVAEGAPAGDLFAAVAEELGNVVLEADVALVGRYEPDDALEVVGGWSRDGVPTFVGLRVALGGHNVSTLVFERNAPARVDHLRDEAAPATALAREWARSAAGAPISVEGRLWGVMIIGSTRLDGMPSEIEDRLASFTDLIATAIANTQAHDDLRRLADEQAALRRVATLVARGAPAAEIFAAVAEEVGGLLGPDHAVMARFDAHDEVTIVAEWRSTGDPPRLEKQRPLSGGSIAKLIQDTGRPVRIDDYARAARGRQSWVLDSGTRAAVAAPITVDGRLWGVMGVGSRGEPPPPGTEERLAGFTELVATAIANSQARGELSALADEQAALRRVATLIAEGASPDTVFAAVSIEAGRLFDAQCGLLRFDPERTATVVGGTTVVPGTPVGTRIPIGGRNAVTRVFETGRPARVDTFAADDPNPLTVLGRTVGTSAVAAPVSVAGRLWGVAVLVSQRDEPFAHETEARLEVFAELVATAIANADTRAELTASRARVIATADETRRRIERDLHDGAQQRLVSLGLELRAAQADVPPELGDLAEELERVATGLTNAQDELREYTRGIHPAVLKKGGLAAALKALARRSTVPVELDVKIAARLHEGIELGSYYIISEALTNAAKHANASRVDIGVAEDDGLLRLVVRDDGKGGAHFVPGSGLVGLKDRVAALGGTLSVESPPGVGTTIEVEIPLTAEAST